MENPSMADMALLARGTYQLGEKVGTKAERVKNAQTMINDTGFIVNPEHSNSQITTYQHKDNPKNVVIAHRGTKVDGRRGIKDIQADLLFALGRGGHQPLFKKRLNKTNQIVTALDPDYLHLTGHSLGGGTVNHTIANSGKVREKLTTAKTYNAAAHPIFSNDTSVPYKYKKELETKVEHHRIKHDPVSMGFKNLVPFGKVKTHKIKHDPKLGKSYIRNIVEKNPSLIQQFYNANPFRFTARGLFAHSGSHFHDGMIKKKKKK